LEVSIGLKLQVQEKVQECLVALLGKEGASAISITLEYSNNLGTTAGLAYRQERHITLNALLFRRNIKHFLSDIIPHETCHIVQFILSPSERQHHGKKWKDLMRSLSLSPNAYHDLDVSAVDSKVHRYVCNCHNGLRFHQVHERSHNLITKGNKSFVCKCCSSRLVFFPRSDNH
jgi:SprT protein